MQFGAVKNPNILKVVFDDAYRKVALFDIFITLQRKIEIPMFSEKTNLLPLMFDRVEQNSIRFKAKDWLLLSCGVFISNLSVLVLA